MAIILKSAWSDGESRSITGDQVIPFVADWSDGESIIFSGRNSALHNFTAEKKDFNFTASPIDFNFNAQNKTFNYTAEIK